MQLFYRKIAGKNFAPYFLLLQTKNIFNYFLSAGRCLRFFVLFIGCECLGLYAFVAHFFVKETSFAVEKGYGFVCLLIFQSGNNPGFFFLAQIKNRPFSKAAIGRNKSDQGIA